MSDRQLRQRKPKDDDADAQEPIQKSEQKPKPKPKPKTKSKKSSGNKGDDDDDDDDDGYDEKVDGYSPWLDVLRVLSFLFLASCALSYSISSGESFFWGMKNKPWWLRTQYWKAKVSGPMYLTPKELSKFDGSDPSKPLYLAINGTIYDVSANRRMYGPGGSYGYFSGVDAARAYVTGCFADDRTPDMRGVEEMFLPLDDPEIEAQWTEEEMRAIKDKEMEAAKKEVYEALNHWVNFFAKSPKYDLVGYVKREDGWLEKQPRRKLCAQAQKGRKKRKPRYGPNQEEEE